MRLLTRPARGISFDIISRDACDTPMLRIKTSKFYFRLTYINTIVSKVIVDGKYRNDYYWHFPRETE